MSQQPPRVSPLLWTQLPKVSPVLTANLVKVILRNTKKDTKDIALLYGTTEAHVWNLLAHADHRRLA